MKFHINRIAALVLLMAVIFAAAGCQGSSDHKHHDSGKPNGNTASANAERKPADGAEPTGTGKDSHDSTETSKEAAKNGSAENSSDTVTKTGNNSGSVDGSGSGNRSGNVTGNGSGNGGNGSGTEQQAQTEQAAAGNSSASEPSGSALSNPVQSTSEQTDASNSNPTVTFSIKGDKKHGTILSSTSIAIEKGDTVLDLLKRVTRKNKIQMEFRGSGATAYVEGIDNLYEFDHGPESGWIYKVNGILVDESAGACEIKKGDVIEWIYIVKRDNDSEGKG